MDNIVRELIKTKIKSLKGTYFQDAMDRIFMCIYGDIGYQRVKQKRDGGSDGIINGHTIIAAYAPENYELRDFKKKISGDYESYKNNWSDTHPNWGVVTNLEATAQMIKHVDGLKTGAKITCVEALLQLISEQTWSKKQNIYRGLDIPQHYLTNDVISTIVEDLILQCDSGAEFKPYSKPAYIEDKIKLNVSEENRSDFAEDYEEFLLKFSMIQSVIGNTPQKNVLSIRSKIREVYMGLNGSFENKLQRLIEIMSKDKINDDYYRYNMRAVMIYFFEQCLFGKKPESEAKNA